MKTIVVGLGNRSFSDDGVGLEVARIIKNSILDKNVTVVELSIAGIDILDVVANYDKAIVVDAVQTQRCKPGTIHRFKPDDTVSSNEISPHDIDIVSSLHLGRKLGLSLPEEIIIYGIETSNISKPEEGCTPSVSDAVPLCVKKIIAELQSEHSD